MTGTFRYGTILRALNDDPHPDNDTEEGDIHIKAGKHEDGDSYTVLTEEGIETVRFETVAVYESEEPMHKREAIEFARDRHVEAQEAEP